MRRVLIKLFLLGSATALTACGYDQAACTTCGPVPATTYVATTSYVPTTTYVATTRYVPAMTTYVVTPRSSPMANCNSISCCTTCNRTGPAYYGYGSGPIYGYDDNNTTWY